MNNLYRLKKIGNKTQILNLLRIIRKVKKQYSKKYFYSKLKSGIIALPSKITYELTNKCNLSCKMCFQKNNSQKELSFQEIKRLFGRLGPNFNLVNLTGGEIFARNDFFEIIEFLTIEQKKNCFLTTNGTLIGNKEAQILKKYPRITGIQFSLDGPEDIHNKIRCSSFAFANALKAIRLLKNDFRISVGCVVMQENLRYLGKLVDELADIGIYNISFAFEMFSTKSRNEETINSLGLKSQEITANLKNNDEHGFTFDEYNREIHGLFKLCQKRGVAAEIVPPLKRDFLKHFYRGDIRNYVSLNCRALAEARINFNGDFILCHQIKKSFGNLLDMQIEDIWNSQELKAIRKKILDDNLTKICERCCKIEAIKSVL